MNGYLSDQDFLDMLRLAQVSALRGAIAPDELQAYASSYCWSTRRETR